MRIVSLTKEAKDNILEDLLKRSPNNYDQYQETVNEILNEVKTKGDEAVFAYTEKFDHAKLTADTLYVTEDEIKEAYEKVDEELIEVMKNSRKMLFSAFSRSASSCGYMASPQEKYRAVVFCHAG